MRKKKNTTTILQEGFSRLNRLLLATLLLGLPLQIGLFYLVLSVLWQIDLSQWVQELLVAMGLFLGVMLILAFVVAQIGRKTLKLTVASMDIELNALRQAARRAKSLQEMSSTMSATLSLERVMEVALDVSSIALEEMGVPAQSLAGAVFLYKGDKLVPVASRRFAARDSEKEVEDGSGIMGESLKTAEPVLTSKPTQDPELKKFIAFQNCQTAACIPLRAGFQIFGAMIVGSEFGVQFNQDHLDLFKAIGDQAVIALQNAQLYQELRAEKQRLIEADEEARKELARNLHDGPTQSIAAIAMHINFIRSLMVKNPRQALDELIKVERLAKQTTKEIRSMLFALRPLVLETEGLAAAIETAMSKIRETDNIKMRLVGGEYGNLLDSSTQSVVFSIVEEALGNARKYSEASLVEVRFWQESDLFVARVQDNGKGFDVESVNSNYSSRGSLGMVNMRERADRIDGSIKVDSTPGRGTAITLVVPITKQTRRATPA